ncbi:hypothetical protein BH11PAT1_BH11PAT1_5470 [soil metagenome]
MIDQANLEIQPEGILPNESSNKPESRIIPFHTVDIWHPGDAQIIHDELEVKNWKWPLATPVETLQTIASTFPEGQLVVRERKGNPIASLITNRVNWNGNLDTLPTWDEVVGILEEGNSVYGGDCTETYKQEGNTLVLLSMNGNPDIKGLARNLLEHIKGVANTIGVEHLIGPFRPSGYGEFKMNILKSMMETPDSFDLDAYKKATDFETYCKMTILKDGQVLPQDAWLRSVTHNGMIPLKAQKDAMKIVVSPDEFIQGKNESESKGNKWIEISPGIWEFGEVGRFYKYNEYAEYKEDNYWGKLPISS